jgi:tRNA (guanine-N7-)-methyltransferase
VAIVRVREHVNPLARKYQTPIESPDWEKVFADPTLPLHLDIGCGRGRFLLEMAQLKSSWNFLGLEIREPLVDQALTWRDEAGLQNLHYLFCNVNNSLHPLLASLPSKSLARVSIQFPDPWFKRKHQKRRVVQPEVVETLSEFLMPGGIVFLQSDVLAVEQEMIDRFVSHPAFGRDSQDWLPENPLPVQTERELMVLSFDDPVYRAVFKRI